MISNRTNLIVLASYLVASGSFSSADEPAESTQKTGIPVAKQEVRLTPLLTIKGDIRRIQAAITHAKELTQSEEPSDFFVSLSVISETDFSSVPETEQPMFQLYISSTFPILTIAVDIVTWGNKTQFQKLIADAAEDETFQELPDGTLVSDSLMGVFSERYFAMRQLDHEYSCTTTLSDLRKLLQTVEQDRLSKTFSISTRPRQTGRSNLQPILAVQKATLETNAQQRDKEDSLVAIGRPLSYRMLTGLFNAFFEDTENVEYSFDYSPHDQSSSVELKFAALKGSEFDRYISRLSQPRNRALSYVHPEHTSFAALSLPLPELLTNVLPDLSSESLKSLQQLAGTGVAPTPAIRQVMSQFAESRQLNYLIQTVKLPEQTQATVMVIPLGAASTLESISVELISATNDGHWQSNFGNVGGWPVHRGKFDEFEFYFTLTDQCVAVVIGPESSLGTLEKVVIRDFDETPSVSRLGRTALAVKTSSVALHGVLGFELPMRIVKQLQHGGPASVNDAIEVSVQTEPHQVSIRATFGPDALMNALELYEMGIAILTTALDLID